MVYYVYILYSEKLNLFYKGQTSDLTKRLERHNAKFEKSTARGAPWELIWQTRKSNRAEALVLEKKLKNLNRKRLVEFMFKYKEGIVNIEGLKNLEFES